MFKTIEAEVLKKHPSPALQREFAQHDFERLKPFCLLIYSASISIWLVLNPFYLTETSLLELKGTMVLFYALFLSLLTLYSFMKLRRAKLSNYIMAKLLLDQACIDTLTDIPNRRAFMTSAGKKLSQAPRVNDHYLAMIKADQALYVSKHSGKDRFTFHAPQA